MIIVTSKQSQQLVVPRVRAKASDTEVPTTLVLWQTGLDSISVGLRGGEVTARYLKGNVRGPLDSVIPEGEYQYAILHQLGGQMDTGVATFRYNSLNVEEYDQNYNYEQII